MLRRLLTFVLAIACACAPVSGAFAVEAHSDSSCCCGVQCPCPPPDHGPAPCARVHSAPAAAAATVASRALARRDAPRVARTAFAPFVSAADDSSALVLRRPATLSVMPAASVALFQAHCSFLL